MPRFTRLATRRYFLLGLSLLLLVLAPRSFHTFKWYARRAEFANWKDVPQDAVGVGSLAVGVRYPLH